MTLFRSMAIRMALVYILLIGGFVYVAHTLYTVQIVRHDELFHKAQSTYTTRIQTHGVRGEIFDFGGSLLVGNMPTMDVLRDPGRRRRRHAQLELRRRPSAHPRLIFRGNRV